MQGNGPQAKCSEGLRATNPTKYDSSSTLGIEISIRTGGPELMVVIHEFQDLMMTFWGHTSY